MYNPALTNRYLCRGKSQLFLPILQSWHSTFIVIPPHLVPEWAHFFLLPFLLQVKIILHSSRGWFWQFQFDNGLFCGQSTFKNVKRVCVFGCKRVAAAKYTVKSIIRGKFSILFFVGVIKPFVGEAFFCLWSFVYLREGIRTCCDPKKIQRKSNSWLSPILKEINWYVFLITVGSMLRSLTRTGN